MTRIRPKENPYGYVLLVLDGSTTHVMLDIVCTCRFGAEYSLCFLPTKLILYNRLTRSSSGPLRVACSNCKLVFTTLTQEQF